MVVKSPGASVPSDLAGKARAAWYQWRHYHEATAADPMAAGLAMYSRGWRDCFLTSVEMAGLRPVLERWVQLMEELRVEQDFAQFIDEKEG